MPTTPIQALPYPGGADAPAGPAQIKALAEAVETRLVMRFASTAARDAALPVGSRIAGMLAWVDADQTYYVWSTNGTASWRVMWRDTAWTTVQTQTASRPLIEARMAADGQSVTLHVNGPLAIPTGSTVVLAEGSIPVALRPTTRDPRVAITADLYQITLVVNRNGGLTVVNNSGAARASFNGATVTYPLG